MNPRLLTWRLICGALFEHGAVGRPELEALLRSPRGWTEHCPTMRVVTCELSMR